MKLPTAKTLTELKAKQVLPEKLIPLLLSNTCYCRYYFNFYYDPYRENFNTRATAVLHITARSLAFNHPVLQPPTDSAPITWIARYLHCLYFLLRYCPAVLDDHGKLPSTVRFKTTRGKTALMELGDLSRHGKQFKREGVNAIGRNEGVWRANLMNGCNSVFSSDYSRAQRARKLPCGSRHSAIGVTADAAKTVPEHNPAEPERQVPALLR